MTGAGIDDNATLQTQKFQTKQSWDQNKHSYQPSTMGQGVFERSFRSNDAHRDGKEEGNLSSDPKVEIFHSYT